MADLDFTIDDVTYTFRQTDFFKANKYLKKLTALLKGCFSLEGNQTGFDIGQLASNIGSEEFVEIEKFVLDYVSAVDENGKTILFQIISEGLKFHFLGFLPNGILSNLSTLSLAEITKKAI